MRRRGAEARSLRAHPAVCRWRRGTLALLAALSLAACSVAQLEEITQRGDVQAVGRVFQQGLPVSPEKEAEIGFGIAATVAGRYRVVADDGLIRYVNLVGQSVAQQSPRFGEVAFTFGVLDTDDVNAFAAPGGYVFITRGALALMTSEAELAAVLAHEVGHVDQRHVIEEIRRGAVIQQARDESQIQGALLDQIADAGTTLLFTGLSREDEMEADSLGILYASATGYRAAGLLDFLNHLRAQEQAGAGGMREWVATHPSTEDRIAAVQRQLAGTAQGGADGAARFRERTGASGGR